MLFKPSAAKVTYKGILVVHVLFSVTVYDLFGNISQQQDCFISTMIICNISQLTWLKVVGTRLILTLG